MTEIYALLLAAIAGAAVAHQSQPESAAVQYVNAVLTYHVTVAADGHIKNCSLTPSTGSAQQDAKTCELITARSALFTPARNQSGKSIESNMSGKVRWKIAKTISRE